MPAWDSSAGLSESAYVPMSRAHDNLPENICVFAGKNVFFCSRNEAARGCLPLDFLINYNKIESAPTCFLLETWSRWCLTGALYYCEMQANYNPVVFAENQLNFSEFSESEGHNHISNVNLESQRDCHSLISEDNARYNDVWLLLSLLGGPKESESFTESVRHFSRIALH